MTKLITTFAAVAMIVGAVPAYAANEAGVFTVSTAGLDMQSAAGAKIMLGRIQTAAGAYCGTAPVIADLGATAAWKQCVKDAVANAVSQLKAPMVSVAYKGPEAQTVAQNTAR